jgi:urease gamma subunit
MSALTPEQVMDGIADIVTQIRVEVLLEEGSRLIVLTHPIGTSSHMTASVSPVGERA